MNQSVFAARGGSVVMTGFDGSAETMSLLNMIMVCILITYI